jgi:transposase-like protein
VKSNVPVAEAINDEAVLPERVQEALGQLVGAAKEGLLALSVGVGLGVLTELMEEEVDDVVGPKSRQDPDRVAVRHGHEDGEVTLGGRRVGVQRPRVRTVDGETEVHLATYEHFADRDPLGRVVLERMLAGVSTRRYRRTQEPVGEQVEVKARSTSKSAVSRTFVERTREALGKLMSRQLADLRLAVMMLDGLELKGRMMIVALGITTEGVKIPLGLWEGSTENATVATALLSDLVERGLDPEQGMLFVLDGSKALRKAVRSVFGEVPVQRCLWHKERNVTQHLLERDRPPIKARMRKAWRETEYPRALEQLTRLADELEHKHPGAAGSLREGMDETLTVIKLGIRGKLRRTLESTNPCESMIDTVRTTQRNVKHWVLRGNGGPVDRRRDARSREAVPQSDRLHRPPTPSGRDRTSTPPSPAQPRHEPGGRHRSHYVTITPGPPSPKFHGDRGNLYRGRLPGLRHFRDGTRFHPG